MADQMENGAPLVPERRTKRGFVELITFKLDRTLAIIGLLLIGLGAEALVFAVREGDAVSAALNVVVGVVGALAGYIGGRSQSGAN